MSICSWKVGAKKINIIPVSFYLSESELHKKDYQQVKAYLEKLLWIVNKNKLQTKCITLEANDKKKQYSLSH